ncbi:Vps35-domain-containing protein, partial [Hanseniaspora valbyensis NRRL Y-1626]
LIESFKYFNILLLELKRDNLSPKEYYELYIEVYDCLTILLNYLKSNHLKLFHLTDIYELVQYSNNLVPRLYLMITCGVAMLHIDDFP